MNFQTVLYLVVLQQCYFLSPVQIPDLSLSLQFLTNLMREANYLNSLVEIIDAFLLYSDCSTELRFKSCLLPSLLSMCHERGTFSSVKQSPSYFFSCQHVNQSSDRGYHCCLVCVKLTHSSFSKNECPVHFV